MATAMAILQQVVLLAFLLVCLKIVTLVYPSASLIYWFSGLLDSGVLLSILMEIILLNFWLGPFVITLKG
jgi:hypothetical protein